MNPFRLRPPVWLPSLVAVAALLLGAATARAQSLSPTGITAAPSSGKPGDAITYTIAVANGTTAQFGPGQTARFTLTFTNLVTGTSFSYDTGNIAPTGGFIAAAAVDPQTGQTTPGAGTFTFTAAIPTQTTHAGGHGATVVLTNVSTGGIGTSTVGVSTPVITVIGDPDFQITSLTYSAGTSFVGGDVIPMSLTFTNRSATNGNTNVPFSPGANGHAQFIRIQVVLSPNPTWGDADDLQLAFFDIDAFSLQTITGNGGSPFLNADNLDRTIVWNQLLPGNFSGSYYVLARIDSFDAQPENDPPVQTVNGNNVWGGNSLNPTGTLINLLPSNFPSTALATHAVGAQTSASGYSDNPSLSSDGRYVAFASDATNLVTGDSNATRDVFLYDSQTTLVRRLSVSQQGAQGNGPSNNPAISADGRYVAFASEANNLVFGDTNNFSDIFVVDVITGLVSRVSVTSGGAQANNPSFRPAISQTGRFIVFESTATNLDPAYTIAAGGSHIYVFDRDVSGSGTFDTAGNTSLRLVDVDLAAPTATAANAASIQATISADGSTIAFASRATNLVADATTAGRQHVYVRPRANVGTATSGIKRVSVVNGTAAEGNANSQTPSLSADGRWIVFASLASNLVAGDNNRVSDIFLYDNNAPAATPIVRRKSVTGAGGEAYDPSPATTAADFRLGSINPTISSDGRFIAFASLAANLTTGDAAGQFQGSGATAGAPTVTGGAITAIPVTAGGSGYSQWTPPVVIITDPNGEPTTRAIAVANVNAAGVVTGITMLSNGAGYSANPIVVIGSDANRGLDIFVHDRDALGSGTFDTGPMTTQMVSRNTFGYQTYNLLGVPSTAASNIYPVISANGRYVAFPSDAEGVSGLAFGATNQLQLDNNRVRDVFLHDRRTNASITPSTPPTVTITSPGNGGTVVVNTPVSVNASATAATFNGTPIGVVSSVEFFVNGTSIGTSTAFPYTATWSPSAVGNYTLSALVTDSFGNTGISPNVTVTVVATPSVGVTSPSGGSTVTVGTAQTVTATAAASNPGATIATVQFFANGVSLGTDTTAPFSASWTPATAGTYTLTAVAVDSLGTQSTSPGVDITVATAGGGGGGSGAPTPPTVAISGPATDSTVVVNVPVALTATASTVNGNIVSVTYSANGAVIGSASAFPFLVTWTPTNPGAYTITAEALDTAGAKATSPGIVINASAGTAPSLALTSPTNNATYAVGTPISVTANPALGSGLLTSVSFFANGVLIGSSSAAPFTTSFTPSAGGTYVFTAVATDSAGNRATSAPVTVTVVGATAPVIAIASPTGGTTIPVNVTQVITANATAATTTTIASVQFLANNQVLGTDNTFPFDLAWTPTAPGTYVLTAIATDTAGLQTTSSGVTVTVSAGSTSLPFVFLTSTPTGTSVAANSPVFISARAGDPDGAVTNVEFFANSQLIGSAATAPYFVTWIPTTAGTHLITAVVTDNAGNRVTSTASAVTATIPVGVLPVASLTFNDPALDTPTGTAPATAPTTTPVNVSFGSKLIFSAAALDPDGAITSVQFFVNGATLATRTAAPYYATYTLDTLNPVVVSALVTDSSGNTVSTNPILIAPQPSTQTASSVVSLITPQSGSNYVAGEQILFTATHNFGNITPPKIDFYVNGAQFTTVGAPPYSTSLGITRAGVYDVHAVARSGTETTISAPARINVIGNNSPSVSITSPTAATAFTVGTGIAIAANAVDADGTIQNVQFFVNGAALSAKQTAPYTATWNPAATGIYTLTALATDNAGNQTLSPAVVVSIHADRAPSVAITTPASGTRVSAGAPLTFAASAADADGQVTTVRFIANGVAVATSTAAPFGGAWTPSSAGTYIVVAQATDNAGNITTSSPITIEVAPNQAPTVAITSPARTNRVVVGVPVTFSATAADTDGTVTNVRFVANGVTLVASTSAPFGGSWTPTAPGIYTVTAQASDNTGNVTTSTPITVEVVANQAPSVALASPMSGSTARVGLARTLTASASDPDGTIASVQFFVNGTAVGGPVTSPPYTVQWTPTAEGIHRLSVVATDNAGGTTTTSDAHVLVVSLTMAGDAVYVGNYQGLNESGRFALISMRGRSASLIAFSTTPTNRIYHFPSLPIDASGNIRLNDAQGRVLVNAFVSETGVSGTMDGGRLTLIGIVTPTAGTIAPGYYTGNLTGQPASTLNAIIGGDGSIALYAADGSFEAAGSGTVDATGTFNVVTPSGIRFTGRADPASGFLTGTLVGGPGGTFNGAVASGLPFSDGFLRNLSTRGQVGTGGNILIAGFVVGGTAPKQVLVRAVGPSLAVFGLSNVLADPQLEIFGGSARIAANDNWGGTASVQSAAALAGAFPLQGGSRDAALLLTLQPGNYTAQVSGVSGATGVALIEFYDMDSLTPFSPQKVMNLSTRGVVGTGQSQLIAGFVVTGNSPKRVLIRGVGPTLGAAPFNLAGALADPVLRLERNDGVLVRENDNWESGNDALLVTEASTRVGAFALARGSRDAVILVSLPPGIYTAQLTGAGTSTGVGLIEVYEVP